MYCFAISDPRCFLPVTVYGTTHAHLEEEEDNDVEVVWAKSARGVWGLEHVFDGKLHFTRYICEEKWIPKDLVPPQKSQWLSPRQEQRLPPSQEQS